MDSRERGWWARHRRWVSRFQSELRTAVRPRPAADLVAAGVTRHVLDGPRWRRTSRGFYVLATDLPRTPTQRILEAAAALPAGAAIGGWAAAFSWGADLLDGLDDHTTAPLPVTVCLPPGLHRAGIPGLDYRQQHLDDTDVGSRAGIPVTVPGLTACDLAARATDLTEAVVALDAVLAAGLLRHLQLPVAPGRRGAAQARRAAGLARTGVRSTWETRLRMLYVLELGFPSPLVNRSVLDLDGRSLGVPDLLDVEAGLVLEYDGARWTGSPVVGGHRDRDQHRADNVREELFERAGLTVVRADGRDLSHYRRRLMARVSAARADGLRRDRSRDRWMVRPSSRQSGFSSVVDREDLLLGRPRLSS